MIIVQVSGYEQTGEIIEHRNCRNRKATEKGLLKFRIYYDRALSAYVRAPNNSEILRLRLRLNTDFSGGPETPLHEFPDEADTIFRKKFSSTTAIAIPSRVRQAGHR